MGKDVVFKGPHTGEGRPQILLIGNGLERCGGQVSWDALVDQIKVADRISLTGAEEAEIKKTISFPLLYELYATPSPAPMPILTDGIKEEEARLKNAIANLLHSPNPVMRELCSLNVDHIMTTNYSYCLENSLLEREQNTIPNLSKYRFDLRTAPQKEGRKVERYYRLHTGYLIRNIGLWHIHGECCSPGGIVLGYDRYGRLLSKIVETVGKLPYTKKEMACDRQFRSWPELFLFGDIYILGFEMNLCEMDLWWLLRRKQREKYGDGKVWFYGSGMEKRTDKQLLLMANGVELVDMKMGLLASGDDYFSFYRAAMEDIRKRVSQAKKKRS